jgi:hypothetical protein
MSLYNIYAYGNECKYIYDGKKTAITGFLLVITFVTILNLFSCLFYEYASVFRGKKIDKLWATVQYEKFRNPIVDLRGNTFHRNARNEIFKFIYPKQQRVDAII